MLATYLLSQRERAARGVLLAAAASICQGVVAVALVYGVARVAGWLSRETSTAVVWSERLSYAIVILVGALLAGRAARDLAATARRRATACAHVHAHVPCVAQVARATDLRTTLVLALSIGMRPCSGAILVLALAQAAGLAWIGVAAVAAMSMGAAMAIATLALLAVNARRWAARMAGERGGHAGILGDLAALVGGGLVMMLGVSLAAASFAPRHPLGLP